MRYKEARPYLCVEATAGPGITRLWIAILTMMTIAIEVAEPAAAAARVATPPEPAIRPTTIEITFLIIIFTVIFLLILITIPITPVKGILTIIFTGILIIIEITILKIILVVILFLI